MKKTSHLAIEGSRIRGFGVVGSRVYRVERFVRRAFNKLTIPTTQLLQAKPLFLPYRLNLKAHALNSKLPRDPRKS